MFTQTLLLAGSALLFAGVAQAAAPETQADPDRALIAQREAPAPTAGDDTKDAGGKTTAKEAGQALSAEAGPVQPDGGDCSGD